MEYTFFSFVMKHEDEDSLSHKKLIECDMKLFDAQGIESLKVLEVE